MNPEGMYSYSWVDCLLESWVEGVDWKAVAVDATKARVKAAEVFMVAVVGLLLEFVSICRKEKTEVVGGRVCCRPRRRRRRHVFIILAPTSCRVWRRVNNKLL